MTLNILHIAMTSLNTSSVATLHEWNVKCKIVCNHCNNYVATYYNVQNVLLHLCHTYTII